MSWAETHRHTAACPSSCWKDGELIPTGRESCTGSIEANDPKPATLATRRQPVFASSIGDDEVSEL